MRKGVSDLRGHTSLITTLITYITNVGVGMHKWVSCTYIGALHIPGQKSNIETSRMSVFGHYLGVGYLPFVCRVYIGHMGVYT